MLRGKAMNLIAERVKVTDTAGHEVDVQAALNAPGCRGAAEDAAAADDDAGDDTEDAAEADAEAADEDDADRLATRRRGGTHDREGFTTLWSSKAFAIMVVPRCGCSVRR